MATNPNQPGQDDRSKDRGRTGAQPVDEVRDDELLSPAEEEDELDEEEMDDEDDDDLDEDDDDTKVK